MRVLASHSYFTISLLTARLQCSRFLAYVGQLWKKSSRPKWHALLGKICMASLMPKLPPRLGTPSASSSPFISSRCSDMAQVRLSSTTSPTHWRIPIVFWFVSFLSESSSSTATLRCYHACTTPQRLIRPPSWYFPWATPTMQLTCCTYFRPSGRPSTTFQRIPPGQH